jgi:hypothetical protein
VKGNIVLHRILGPLGRIRPDCRRSFRPNYRLQTDKSVVRCAGVCKQRKLGFARSFGNCGRAGHSFFLANADSCRAFVFLAVVVVRR